MVPMRRMLSRNGQEGGEMTYCSEHYEEVLDDGLLCDDEITLPRLKRKVFK